MRFSSLIWVVSQLVLLVHSSQHGHHQHHRQKREFAGSTTPSLETSGTISALAPLETSNAADMVARALEVLKSVNKLRVENVQYNQYEFKVPSDLRDLRVDSAPLNYSMADVKKLNDIEARDTHGALGGTDQYSYSIPPELRKAARIMAEATPPTPSTGKQSAIATRMRAKYGTDVPDTLVPPQALQGQSLDGLGVTEKDMMQVAIGEVTGGGIEKRAASTWWMANIEQRGVSPFSPPGYKVWRNVMDYGAVGDGVTDDTAAINHAISDGDRCGANCGSSTIYPAVVYFPPGSYLASSPIIQYYNTQLIGDPVDLPTIIGASSFVGLGVITSDVYVGAQEEWYLNTNNFLRSIRNFKIDITRTNQDAYICAIHWQVAQGTSLENIEFYMSQDAATTQQGLYMENGSGGFMADLTFIGGNFGAYLGNQQFTTSHLVFVQCKTAMQIHWDWGWTMQDVVVESCDRGIVIVGGAGGPFSTGQGVGSLSLVDAVIANTQTGIVTTLYNENSTALLLQNVGFYNTQESVLDNNLNQALVPGTNQLILESWGFGMVNDADGSQFIPGADIPASNRTASLIGSNVYNVKPNYFSRRRPKYHTLGHTQVLDVKTLGARGDGVTDDTLVLNSILALGANMSSIVYFPFGVYKIQDTLEIPTGTRILGQAWSQIMATGSAFEKAYSPKVAVKVGNKGDSGIVEIQDMLFTVSGPTAGAVLMEWNVHETAQGSADSHFRVGGAIGSELQAKQCPKQTGGVDPNCIAAALLLRLARESSAYLENVWVWTADHDLDVVSQEQIDVYAARGVLIESQGPTWLYGTASEHHVLYQYQLHEAKNIVMGMIQTESPYYQPVPRAPRPFGHSLFPADPNFDNCTEASMTCSLSWALRVLDSSSVYLLGAGFYSWFSDYSQACLDGNHCQDRGFQIEQSYDIWTYNLVTKAIKEMVSPTGEKPTYASDNKNGFLASLLAWVRGPKTIIGSRDFHGYTVWDPVADAEALRGVPDKCKAALTALIKCNAYTQFFLAPSYRRSLHNETLTDSVCDENCGESLQHWFNGVATHCEGYNVSMSAPTKRGGRIWAGWNETCLTDPTTGEYCNDFIEDFPEVSHTAELPKTDLCSFCFVERLAMMQRSSYSVFDESFQEQLEVVYDNCPAAGPTAMPPSLDAPPDFPPDPICVSGNHYTTSPGDTCDSIATGHNISSAALFMANPQQSIICDNLMTGMTLCLPMPCPSVYTVKPNDTCVSIEMNNDHRLGDVRRYNAWVEWDCSNLQISTAVYGHVICMGPQGGTYTATAPIPNVTLKPNEGGGYAEGMRPPPANSTVADGTTLRCGRWHVATKDDSCVGICVQESITSKLFLQVNPSLTKDNCTPSLMPGCAYCVGPNPGWETPLPELTALSDDA